MDHVGDYKNLPASMGPYLVNLKVLQVVYLTKLQIALFLYFPTILLIENLQYYNNKSFYICIKNLYNLNILEKAK